MGRRMDVEERAAQVHPPTLTEIRDRWPATVGVPRAATAFGISRSYAYELITRGEFPAKVIRAGGRFRVVTASIIRALSDEAA
jgi:predicted DNA-binding transcriptional regulator AlpA